MSASIPKLRRHPSRIVPSVLVCLAILIPAGYLVWAIVVRFSAGTWPSPIATGAPAVLETPLSHPAVVATAIIAAVVGLVLILCAVIPGRYRNRVLRVDEDLYPGHQETVLTHHGLANILRTRTGRLDGVQNITADVTDRRAELTVQTPLRATDEVTDRVRAAAGDAVGRIPFVKPPAVAARTGRSRR